MFLSDFDLRQIDDEYLESLNSRELLELSKRLTKDLKIAVDRLNQNPSNSSRPPSSSDPWVKANLEGEKKGFENTDKIDLIDIASELEEEKIDESAGDPEDKSNKDEKDSTKEESNPTPGRKPGRQKGAKGHGRTVILPITDEIIHRAEECSACSCRLDEESEFIARTGNYILDIEVGNESNPGIRVTNTKHIYGDTICSCGHITRTKPHSCESDPKWNVDLTEWHIVGPMLMALICCLSLRKKMSRKLIREFLIDWLYLPLSVGTINQCIHESGRAASPVVENQLLEEVNNSGLLHIDETSWKEKGHLYYLWAFVTATVTLYIIGSRGRVTLESVLKLSFVGWLMSDGYLVYRYYKNRLRCWAHLFRKAKGLFESLDKEAQVFGKEVLDVLNALMKAVYKAREGPCEDLNLKYQELLDQFQMCCKKYYDSTHEKTRSLAREFLNDWDAIFCVLAHPELPLTNNEAERALRPWVILRKICFGSRTNQGSRVFAILASIIDTCRKRRISPWKYLAKVIYERRRGNEAPLIPAAS